MPVLTTASIITVSYRGDLELARELCTSVDQFADGAIEHILIVPRAELGLFEPMAGPHRRVISKEDVLRTGFYKLPLPYRLELKPFYSRLIREMWWTPVGLSRGWIVQQLIKLAAPSLTDREIIVFADSDIVLVRPLRPADFVIGDKIRLYHAPGATKDSQMHQAWHRGSARLLGLPEKDYFGSDYIGHLVSMSRTDMLRLHDRLELVNKTKWTHALAREKALSEYVLYGIFVEHVLRDESKHAPSPEKLVHACWHYDIGTPAGRSEFVRGFRPEHLGVAIQSTTDFPLEERRRLIAEMTAAR